MCNQEKEDCTRPLVSVIVPIFNVENQIETCLDSLQRQTMKRIECILLDDGSTDRSGTIAKQYAERFPDRFSFYSHKNMGLSRTRNRGISLAKGNYIGFVDSDDYVEDATYERLYKRAVKEQAEIVYAPFYIEDALGNGSVVGKIKGKNIKEEMMEGGTVSFCNKLFQKELLIENGEIPDIWFEDFAYVIPLLTKCRKLAYVSTASYHYIKREDSIMGQRRNKRSLEMLKAWNLALENSLPQYRDNIRINILKRIPELTKHYFLYQKSFIDAAWQYASELEQESVRKLPEGLLVWIEREQELYAKGIASRVFVNGFGKGENEVRQKETECQTLFLDKTEVVVLNESTCEWAMRDSDLCQWYHEKQYARLAKYCALQYMSRQGGVYIGDFVEVTGCFDYLRKYQGAWAMLDEETMSEEIFAATPESTILKQALVQCRLSEKWGEQMADILMAKSDKEVRPGIKKSRENELCLSPEVTVFDIGTQENICVRVTENGYIKDGQRQLELREALRKINAEKWKQEILKLRKEKKELLDSTSWRVTKWLRKGAAFIKNI